MNRKKWIVLSIMFLALCAVALFVALGIRYRGIVAECREQSRVYYILDETTPIQPGHPSSNVAFSDVDVFANERFLGKLPLHVIEKFGIRRSGMDLYTSAGELIRFKYQGKDLKLVSLIYGPHKFDDDFTMIKYARFRGYVQPVDPTMERRINVREFFICKSNDIVTLSGLDLFANPSIARYDESSRKRPNDIDHMPVSGQWPINVAYFSILFRFDLASR